MAGGAVLVSFSGISVIVPHYDDVERLKLCLDALEAQSLLRSRFEIIVADNGSPGGKQVLAALIGDRARMVIVPEKGAGPARTGGAAEACGGILNLTDCDCLPEPVWLAHGVAALARYDMVGGDRTSTHRNST